MRHSAKVNPKKAFNATSNLKEIGVEFLRHQNCKQLIQKPSNLDGSLDVIPDSMFSPKTIIQLSQIQLIMNTRVDLKFRQAAVGYRIFRTVSCSSSAALAIF